jgi:uncharacterized protein YecA (UPF0149 family)
MQDAERSCCSYSPVITFTDPQPAEESRPGDLKLGGNDPCWCGSGKKYKHCHRHSDLGRE